MRNSCQEHKYFCHFMPMNSECSCFWLHNNGLWRMKIGFMLTKFWIDAFVYAQFVHVHAQEHAWTRHEQGMIYAWSYFDCG